MISSFALWRGTDRRQILPMAHGWRATAWAKFHADSDRRRYHGADALVYSEPANRVWFREQATEELGIFSVYESVAVYLFEPSHWPPAYVKDLLADLDAAEHPVHLGVALINEGPHNLDEVLEPYRLRINEHRFDEAEQAAPVDEAVVATALGPVNFMLPADGSGSPVPWFEVENRVRTYLVLSTAGPRAAQSAGLARGGELRQRVKEAGTRSPFAWQAALEALAKGAEWERLAWRGAGESPVLTVSATDRVRWAALRHALSGRAASLTGRCQSSPRSHRGSDLGLAREALDAQLADHPQPRPVDYYPELR